MRWISEAVDRASERCLGVHWRCKTGSHTLRYHVVGIADLLRGTLTLTEILVVSAGTAEATYQITGNGYAPEGEVRKNGKPADKKPVLVLMGRVYMLCKKWYRTR